MISDKKNKILFVGSVHFSYKMLEFLIKNKFNICAVLTKKRKIYKSDYADLTNLAKKNGINSFYINDINGKKSFITIKKFRPDYIFCLGWSQILKKRIIKLVNNNVIGFHPSDLPQNRGKHPIIWSLVNGLKKTASTFFLIDEGIDTGKIISKRKIKISNTDDARSLYKKIILNAKNQLKFIFADLKRMKFKRKEKREKSNYWRKRSYFDGQIDWRMAASSINNLVRALSKPYDGAHFKFKNKDYKILKTKVIKSSDKNLEAGKIFRVKKNVPMVKCGIDAIKIVKCDPKIKFKINTYL
tara:strand:+ start:1132 stop:2028 length:897 start_codon:yes stop_codon:yes gene_type:complete